jgi:protein Mpv17
MLTTISSFQSTQIPPKLLSPATKSALQLPTRHHLHHRPPLSALALALPRGGSLQIDTTSGAAGRSAGGVMARVSNLVPLLSNNYLSTSLLPFQRKAMPPPSPLAPLSPLSPLRRTYRHTPLLNFLCKHLFGGASPLVLYKRLVLSSPLLTKIMTTQIIFVFSYYVNLYLAQDWSRDPAASSFEPYNASPVAPVASLSALVKTSPLLCTLLLPGLYFPVTSHYWYQHVTRLFPQTTIPWVFFKSVLGQVFYGPLYTSVFFVSALVQADPSPSLRKSLANTLRSTLASKLKTDFYQVWKIGVWYWIIVDVICFSVMPSEFVNLFVNVMSFFWTVFLGQVSRREQQ